MTTKDQERKVLAQIKKLVEGLGENSYVGMAFEGCFEDAEQNIENDFGCSMKDRWETSERELKALKNESKQQIEHLTAVRKQLEKQLEEKTNQAGAYLKDGMAHLSRERDLEEQMEQMTADMDAMRATVEAADEKLEAKELEIMKLKARLFDLMNA